ncbi:MAG: hypothetical protein K4304_12540 [Propionicimonas sp.]
MTQSFPPPPPPLQPLAGPTPAGMVAPNPGPVPPGQGLLRINIQGSTMTSSMIVPSLIVDGYRVNSRYGVNVVPVASGQHHVELYAQWMRRYGQASLAVEVPPGGAVDVYYAAPVHQFTTGSIGLTKQPRKGVLVFIGMLLVIFGLLALPIVFTLLG